MLTTQLTRACMRAAEADAKLDEWGVMCPDPLMAESPRNLFMNAYPRMIEILQLLGSSSFMLTPSEADFKGPLKADIEQYLATDKTAGEGPGQTVPARLGPRRQRLRQPPGVVRALLCQRPVDAGAGDRLDLPEEGSHGPRPRISRARRRQSCEGGKDDRKADVSAARQLFTCATPSARRNGTRTCSGLHTYEYRPGWAAFMSADREQSHEVALMQLGPDAPLQQKGQVGLNHMAWRLESLDDLKEFYQRIKETGSADRAGSPITASRSASICATPTATASRSITRCRAPNGRIDDHVFTRELIGDGRFPGPWDAELRSPARRRAVAAQSACCCRHDAICPWPGLTRPSTPSNRAGKGVDTRVKPAHGDARR